MSLSIQSQRIILWWGVAFMVIFALAWVFFLEMVPPPGPSLSAAEVAAYYVEHATKIKIGAVICSWGGGACMVPFSLVIAFQLARMEQGKPVWSVLSFGSGCLMSMFLVFPPIIWGVIAFEPTRPAEITMALNQLANLTLASTDQYYIFQMVAIWWIAVKAKPDPLAAFPRWLGYLNLWIAILFEVGALCFMFKTGPWAWDGLIVFWMPFTLYFFWMAIMYVWMFRALRLQEAAGTEGEAPIGFVAPQAR